MLVRIHAITARVMGRLVLNNGRGEPGGDRVMLSLPRSPRWLRNVESVSKPAHDEEDRRHQLVPARPIFAITPLSAAPDTLVGGLKFGRQGTVPRVWCVRGRMMPEWECSTVSNGDWTT